MKQSSKRACENIFENIEVVLKGQQRSVAVTPGRSPSQDRVPIAVTNGHSVTLSDTTGYRV